MKKDAELHAEEDKKHRDEAETRNRADQAVYHAEKMLKDAGDKLSASDKQPVESAIEAVKAALSQNDQEAITKALNELTSAQHRAAEVLYKQSQASPGAESSPEPDAGQAPAKEGDVIDAEVVEDEKK
jgi:molecular chaperone DnaK